MDTEAAVRLGAFLGVFVVMAIAERWAPRRPLGSPRRDRWFANIGIVIVNTLTARLVMPILPVGAALWAEREGIGLFHHIGLPEPVIVLLGLLVLDAAIYAQHVTFHKVPILWRLHRMHHADTDIDVTTGARFHPIEILLSLAIKIGLVLALGIPATVVIAFEVLLNATAMFNHANVAIPPSWDRVIRTVLVTPDMHRIHHSTRPTETDSNYGFNLSCWDRLFGTYRAQPVDGHLGMRIGLTIFRQPVERRLDRLLTQPFRNPKNMG